MSSAVVSTSAAHGRPFLFDADPDSKVGSHGAYGGTAPQACPERSRMGYPVERSSTALRCLVESTLNNQKSKILPSSVTPASRLEVRPAPEMASSGILEIDALSGGLPRGCLTEICGPASSGRTTIVLSALAAATHRGEFCALIDASDALDPNSLAAAKVDLDRLLWVRCTERSAGGSPAVARASRPRSVTNQTFASEHRLEQVLRVTDLLLESGGFSLIILDLADMPPQSARRIPLTTWFRFRRAVEHKPTILLAIEQHPIAGSCSSLLLQLAAQTGAQKSSGRLIPLTQLNANGEAAIFLGHKLSGQAAPHQCSNLSREAAPFGHTIPGRAEPDQYSKLSRQAASWESPACQCRVASEQDTESRRDGTPARSHETDPAPAHAHLLAGLEITAELIRSRVDRKPSQSITFDTKTAWAG